MPTSDLTNTNCHVRDATFQNLMIQVSQLEVYFKDLRLRHYRSSREILDGHSNLHGDDTSLEKKHTHLRSEEGKDLAQIRIAKRACLGMAYALTEEAINALLPPNAKCAVNNKSYTGELEKLFSKICLLNGKSMVEKDKWPDDWIKFDRLRMLRNRLMHDGGIMPPEGARNKQQKRFFEQIDERQKHGKNGLSFTPLFENSVYKVLVIDDMEFTATMTWLQRFACKVSTGILHLTPDYNGYKNPHEKDGSTPQRN